MKVQNQGIPLTYKKAQEIPQQCLQTAQILVDQKETYVHERTNQEIKAVLMDSVTDARVFEIFTENALALSGEKRERPFNYLDYYAVGMTSGDKDRTGKLERVIALSCDRPEMMHVLGMLEPSYGQVYHMMCHGWVESKPEDYPNTFDKQDPEKFALFVKKKTLIAEDTLVRCMVHKLELDCKVFCASEWQRPFIGYGTTDYLYLWVNKESRSDIVEKLSLIL